MNFIQDKMIRQRLYWSVLIAVCYFLGRQIAVPGVPLAERAIVFDKTSQIVSSITAGNTNTISLFTLGLGPWMITLILWRIFTLGKDNTVRRMPASKAHRIKIGIASILSFIQALGVLIGLQLEWYTLLSSCLVLMTGVMLLVWLGEMNVRYGIGGATLIILLGMMLNINQNVLLFFSDMMAGIEDKNYLAYGVVAALCIVIVLVVVLIEKSEYRVFVQRIMINTNLHHKNYIPIKINSSNGMSIMYALSVMTLPQYILMIFNAVLPNNEMITWFLQNMSVSKVFGGIMYVFVVFFLTISFSLINVAPDELAKQLQKRNDYIPNVLPGRPTERYLTSRVRVIAYLNAWIICSILFVPFILNVLTQGQLEQILLMPSMIIVIISMLLNIIDQLEVLRISKKYDTLF